VHNTLFFVVDSVERTNGDGERRKEREVEGGVRLALGAQWAGQERSQNCFCETEEALESIFCRQLLRIQIHSNWIWNGRFTETLVMA
jgi:hypothetical protein